MNNHSDILLETRLFDLLETECAIRLGDLVRMRRVSRARRTSLLDVAFSEGRLDLAQAKRLAAVADFSWIPDDGMFDEESELTFPGLDDSLDSLVDVVPCALTETMDLADHIDSLMLDDVASPPASRPTMPTDPPSFQSSQPLFFEQRLSATEASRTQVDIVRSQARTYAQDFALNVDAVLAGDERARYDLGRHLGWATRSYQWLIDSGEATQEDYWALNDLTASAQAWADAQGQVEWSAYFAALNDVEESADLTGESPAIGAVVDIILGDSPMTISIYRHVVTGGTPGVELTKQFEGTTRIMSALSPGDYALRLNLEGKEWEVPFSFDGENDLELLVTPPPEQLDMARFSFIQAGSFTLGGDVLAHQSTASRSHQVDAFGLGREAITCKEYCDFLNNVSEARADEHAPRDEDGTVILWTRTKMGYTVPTRDHLGQEWRENWPITNIRQADAEAYCAWLNETVGPGHRLPSEDEWEVAARGPKAHSFPWGNLWTGQECLNRRASGDEPRGFDGDYPLDRAPFGTLRMAGGVSDMTSTSSGASYIVKGGHWDGGAIECRAASRFVCESETRLPTLGFRVAFELNVKS